MAPTGPPPEPTPLEIEQGVIEEARRRQRRRRLGIALAIVVVAALAAAVVGLVPARGAGSRAPRTGGSGPQRAGGRSVTSGRPLDGSDNGRLRIFPTLGAGEVGWDTSYRERGEASATCCSLLTHEAEILEGGRGPHSKGWWTATVLAAPGVASVSAEGRKPVATHAGGLPYGLRFAVLKVRHLRRNPVPFDAHGKRIKMRGFQTKPKRHLFEGPYAPRHWHAPAMPPAAPCEITAASLPALTALEGAVVGRVKGYRSLGSPAFQSCANTVYRFEGETLEGAILLDAEHPGSRPAPLPGMTPVPGKANVFQAPGGGTGMPYPAMRTQGELQLTARRLPGAWLVVAGGKRLAPRLALLSDLHATVTAPD